MCDPIWENKSQSEFEEVLRDALRISSKGVLVGLAASPLAHTWLVEGCFLAGEAISDHLRGLVTQNVLRWGINQLRPTGTHSWTDEAWRQYNVLFYPYIEDVTFEKLAEKMGLSTSAVYQWRPKAVAALTEILWKEVQSGANAEGRKNEVIGARYALLTDEEQTLLRMAAVVRRPFASSLLHNMATEADMGHVATSIRHLISLHFLISHDEGAKIEIHAELRAYLLPWLLPQERQAWHRVAAEHEEAQGEHLEAAYHFLRTAHGEGYELAAQSLVENQQAIIDNRQTNELREMLAQFRPHQLSDKSWARVKIAAGDVALLLEDVESALAEYGVALGTRDMATKGLAYYRRAKAFESQSLDEAIMHYNIGIKYLETWPKSRPLLADMYIDRAWFYLQERPDFEKVESNLNQAQTVIQTADSRRRANLHNAWAKLKEGDDGELEHRLQAWLAATETQDSDLMIKTAHNLGLAYVWSKRYEQGLIYLQKGQALAKQIGARLKEGGFQKTIGACYFFQAQYEKAIVHYKKAYEILDETGDHNWLGHVCHDLAEAYTEIGEQTEAIRYFDEATTIAQRLGEEELLQALDDLARKHPWLRLTSLEHDLNKHQRKAFDFVRQTGRITNKQYRELTGVAKKTASRHLAELCKKGVLAKKGRGPGTHYTLPGHLA
ncbi:MAG: tetratricopeptide repeat protein [Ardenticatenaceae bacterium]